MRFRLGLAATAFCAALPLGNEAAACMWNYPLEVGGSRRTEAERERARAAQARYESRELFRARSAQALTALAQGYDITGALAEMLVPNVRPVPIERSDSCGASNEIDFAEGEETVADLLAGTRFAGWADRYLDFAPPWEGETIGPACNAEFRGRFVAVLRRRMTEPQRRDAYLFLASRIANWKGDPAPLGNAGHLSTDPRAISRLVAFEGRTRRPPIRWTAASYREERSIRRWIARHSSGRALQAAIDEFWRESEPLLLDSERTCPEATARWPSVQARIVAPLEAWVARYPGWTAQPRRR